MLLRSLRLTYINCILLFWRIPNVNWPNLALACPVFCPLLFPTEVGISELDSDSELSCPSHVKGHY